MQDRTYGNFESSRLERVFQDSKRLMGSEPAHDFEHVMRVYKNAKFLCKKENLNSELVLAASLLHDIISHPKTGNNAKNSAKESADAAKIILEKSGYSNDEVRIITDAIADHGFSLGKTPKTVEGKILQDADRLDALGAVGIARTFAVAGSEGRQFYDPEDPFCKSRIPDDNVWTVDHFYNKLLVLEKTMHTDSAKTEAKRRTKVMIEYLEEMRREIQP